MAYQLVVEKTGRDPDGVGRAKDVGENVFLSDLAADYRCYAFYYPAAMPDPDLEKALRDLGEQAGKNLFINIGMLNDPGFDKITGLFEIERFPVIVITAVAPLAAPVDGDFNAYVRLDSPKLLGSSERAVQAVQEVSTLFLQGKVAEAIAKGKWKERSELLKVVGDCITGALGALWKYVSKAEISVSLIEGRFEIKPSGG